MDFSKFDDATLLAEYKRAKGQPAQAAQPIATAQAGVTQDDDINALIQTALGRKSNRNFGESIANAVSIAAGGKGIESPASDYQKIIAEQAIKKQFAEPNYVVSYDANGQPIFTKAPGEIKNAPFYATQQGGQYYGAKTEQAEAQAKNFRLGSSLVESAMSGNGGNVPVGATASSGGITVPLNPKLTPDESSAISSTQTFEPQVENIASKVKGGVFNSGMGDIGRTAKQAAVDSGIPLFTSMDPELQAVQSELNSIRRYAFGEGGKNLTGTERDIVYALLNTTGKSDDQIIQDHRNAIKTIQAKSNLALGGMNEARKSMGAEPTQTTNDLSSMSDDELRKIAGL